MISSPLSNSLPYPNLSSLGLTRQCKDRQGHKDLRPNESRHDHRLLSQSRAFPSKIKDVNVKDALSRGSFLQDSAHQDRSSSIRSELWCLPMSAILDHKPTTNSPLPPPRWSSGEPTLRVLPAACHSFFFPRLFLFPSLSTPYPATCGVSFFLLLSLALSHTPVDLLGNRSDWCTRQVFDQWCHTGL